MGVTNLRYGLEDKIARFRGELEARREEVRQIEEGITRLSALHQQITELEKLIAAGETLLKHDHPETRPERIKPIRPKVRQNPIPFGELGRTVLTILRELPEQSDGMRTRDIARETLRRYQIEGYDRAILDTVTNAAGAYLKKREGDLVRSNGEYCCKWQVIR